MRSPIRLSALGGLRRVRALGGRPRVRTHVVATLLAGTASVTLLGSDEGGAARQEAAARVPLTPAAPASATAALTPLELPQRAAQGSTPRRAGSSYYRRTTSKRVPASAERGFVPLYREAAETFGVSWRLIASVHRQETAFSTVASTYHGLNAFGCCAGPMQFNVVNGPVSTWKLYRRSFRRGDRPRSYPHRTTFHPSVYDDFDAIMAAGALLRDAGATGELDGGSWLAAYGYYGHDTFGVTYASQVLGRALGWERGGFCLNCPDDAELVAELDDTYGVDARQQLRDGEQLERDERARKRSKRRERGERRERKERRRRAERRARRALAEREDAVRRSSDRSSGGRATPATAPSRRMTPKPPAGTTQAKPPPTPSAQPATPPPATPAPEPAPPPSSGGDTCTPLSTVLGCGR